MRPVRLLIFDLDGTLVNTLEDITASVNYTLQKLGCPVVPIDAVRQYVGDGIEMLMSRALAGKSNFLTDAVGIYKVHHSRNLVVRSAPYPGVRDMLDHFRAVPKAIVSNKSAEFVLPLLEQLDIAGSFDPIIGADAGLPMKPAPDAINHIVSRFNVPKESTVMIGDGLADVRAGKAAGVITCAVTYGFRSEEELRGLEPDYVINSIAGLHDLFTANPGRV